MDIGQLINQTIKPQSDTLLPGLLQLRAKILTLAVIGVMSVIGYWLAPGELAPGRYTAHIDVKLNGVIETIPYDFMLGQSADQPLTITTAAGSYQLIVEGEAAYPPMLGQQLRYRLQVRDAGGRPIPLAFEDVTSTIKGPNYRQVLPPTQRSEGWLVFTMRLPYRAKTTLALLLAVAGFWLTELIPLAAGALLIPVVAVLAGVTDAQTVLAPFAHPIIMLFLAGFLMAEGMRRTGVDRLVALTILRRASLKPTRLMLTMMSLTAFLSMWMSNTASVAIIIPIALAILDRIPWEAGDHRFRQALILGVAYAAAIGGVGSAIGTPANILAMTFLNEYAATRLTFVDWFRYGLPMVMLMVPIIWLYLLLAFGVKSNQPPGPPVEAIYRQELADLGRLRIDQKVIMVTFVALMGLWLTEAWHGLPTTITALAGVLVLFFTGIIRQADLNRINWNALLTFGGGLAIGALLVNTGVSDWLALRLAGLVALPPLIVVFIVAGLTLLVGAFISNTACAAMLVPLAIPLARILQLDPRLLVVVVAIGSSIDFALVVGTPPTMLAYSTGLFKSSEIFKRGIGLDLIGLLLLSFGVIWIWRLFGGVSF